MAITFLNHKPDKTNKIVVDHIDNNRTNNCLENLRLLSNRENIYRNRTNCSSKYKGVNYNKAMKKWRAIISVNKKSIHLGYFTDEYEAHLVYEQKAKELRG